MTKRLLSTGIAAAAVIGIALSLVACASETGAPEIDSVSPAQLPAGGSALLLIKGSGFSPTDRVRLGGRILASTQWINGNLLSARVPAGLPFESYALVVTDSQGHAASKQSALQIGASVQSQTPPRAGTDAPTGVSARATAEPGRVQAPTSLPVTQPPVPTFTPGAATQTAISTLDVSGQWRLIDTIQPDGATVTFDDIALQQQGDQVRGAGSGITSLTGTIRGHTLVASYAAQHGTSGEFVWTFSSDGNHFTGTFTSTTPNRGSSAGVRLGAAASVAAAALRSLARSALQGHGHGATKHGRGRDGG